MCLEQLMKQQMNLLRGEWKGVKDSYGWLIRVSSIALVFVGNRGFSFFLFCFCYCSFNATFSCLEFLHEGDDCVRVILNFGKGSLSGLGKLKKLEKKKKRKKRGRRKMETKN